MGFIPHIELLKRHKFVIVSAALLFWVLLGLLVYFTEYLASAYFGAKAMDVIEQRQYILRWLIWLVLTPLILFLGLKINVGNCKLVWFVLLHLLLGTCLLAIEFFVEYLILQPMASSFYQRDVSLDEMAIPFLYKYFGYIVNYFLMVGVVNMYVYMNSLYTTKQHLLQTEVQNKELNYQLTLAQFQTLKMQIQPHFLFNTHQSILGLIALKENEKASLMLTKLSDLLRSVLERQETQFVSLNEELSTIDLYIDIQQVRFNDRLVYEKHVASQVADLMIPYFLLQPIVENAIQFGVEQTDEQATISLTAFVRNHQLVIEIVNPGELHAQKNHQGRGIGLSNIQQRLKSYYGDQASFNLSSTIEFGTKATLILPVHAD